MFICRNHYHYETHLRHQNYSVTQISLTLTLSICDTWIEFLNTPPQSKSPRLAQCSRNSLLGKGLVKISATFCPVDTL